MSMRFVEMKTSQPQGIVVWCSTLLINTKLSNKLWTRQKVEVTHMLISRLEMLKMLSEGIRLWLRIQSQTDGRTPP